MPRNCSECHRQASCNAAMYMSGCGFFPPGSEGEKKPSTWSRITKFFAKFFS